jgi:hypothetical protein
MQDGSVHHEQFGPQQRSSVADPHGITSRLPHRVPRSQLHPAHVVQIAMVSSSHGFPVPTQRGVVDQ